MFLCDGVQVKGKTAPFHTCSIFTIKERKEPHQWLKWHEPPPPSILASHDQQSERWQRISSASTRWLSQPGRGWGDPRGFYVSVKCQIPCINEQNAQPRPAQPVSVSSGSNYKETPSHPQRRVSLKWTTVSFCHSFWTTRAPLKCWTLASLVELMPCWTVHVCGTTTALEKLRHQNGVAGPKWKHLSGSTIFSLFGLFRNCSNSNIVSVECECVMWANTCAPAGF